nr:fertility inhibition protein FinO [Escherichia coli]
MNNPLEAVTQAVNSLVTALKLPDESAKANEVLGEMSFPQFSRLLPYRDYNQESGLFMNDTTMGFMLEAIPINGANESIVEALDHMLRTKLPRGIPLCIHLMSSQLVGDRIEYGLREFSWSGEQAERFNAIIRDVLLEDVAQRNIPLSHKKLRRALKAITRSESYLCAMKAGACRYDTEGYVTEHISQEEEAYAAGRLEKIRRQNRTKAELQAVLDGK